MKLAFLGPPGTFGEMAAMGFAPGAEMLPCPSHAAVAAAVDSGVADAGVVAIENSISGSVAETLDILIHDTALQILAELVVPIEHNLIVKPGTRAADVRVIYSHPQAFGQCQRFLQREFPAAHAEAALSTAEAVGLMWKRTGDAAAIGTARAAELQGASVLARGIQDAANNATRFLLIGHGTPPPTGHDRTSIAFTFAVDRPGSLAGVLNEFASRAINCSKIESRPTRLVFGEYVFLIDFDCHRSEPLGAGVLEAIRPLCADLKVLGSYPRWQ